MNKFVLAAVVGIVVEAGDLADGTLCAEGTTCLTDCVNTTCPGGSCENAGTLWTTDGVLPSDMALWKCGIDPNATAATAAPATTNATAAPATNETIAPATNATQAPATATEAPAPADAPATTEEGSSMPTWAIALLAIAGLAAVGAVVARIVMGGNKKKDKKKDKKEKKDPEAPPAQVEPLVSPRAQPQPQAFAVSVGPVHAPALSTTVMHAPPVYSTAAPVHSARGTSYTMLPTSQSAVPVYTHAPQSHMLVSSAQAPVITHVAQPQ